MPLWLANRQRIPLVLHFQDLQLDAARNLGILPSQKLFALLEHLERFLITQAAAVTTISRGMSARLVEKGSPAARVHLLPNWADLGHIQPIPRQNFIRRQLGISSKIIVLYAGNMGEKQGLEIILESAGLTSKRQDIRYLLVGEGAAKAKLATLARNKGLDNIIFLPLQSEQDLPFLLSSGDIHLVVQKQQAADLVMPSKLGNIMAAGRPFIATALPDTELGQVTQVSAAGLLVPPEDHQSLTRAILKLANDADLRQDMGMKARQYAEARLDRDTILPRFEKLLVHLANR
jgi:colanic acid biosynthesis glycosyl transferase WcaI